MTRWRTNDKLAIIFGQILRYFSKSSNSLPALQKEIEVVSICLQCVARSRKCRCGVCGCA